GLRLQAQDRGAAHARRVHLPREQAAGELRELPGHKRGRAGADLRAAPPRQGGVGGHLLVLSRARGRPCRLFGTGVGARHSTLHLPAATHTRPMRLLTASAACCAALLFAGCETDSSDIVHTVLSPREAPRSRVFQGDTRAVYEAARAAADELGYRVVRGGPAEGRLDALSGIAGGDEAGSSRQIS